MDFAPPPLTPRQKRIVLVLSLLIALTRLLAVAETLFDWDEALFSLGVRDYDVSAHQPHPPGYPLYIAAAKAVHATGLDEFRSLQVVVTIGAFFIFPALFLFVRELGFGFTTSSAAAAIYAFLPNVWIYGGTGFSDVPSNALLFAACWLLMRSRRSSRDYVLGAVVLGIAVGFRTPNLLIALPVALLATWARVRARAFAAIIAAAVLGGVIAGGSYAGAALASRSVEAYREILATQKEYVRKVDSWQNPGRPDLGIVGRLVFLWPFNHRPFTVTLAALALVGVVATALRRRWLMLLPLAMFLPFMVVAWFTLDIETMSRYAISYMALHTIFTAAALRAIARRAVIQGLLAALIVIVFAAWSWPALTTQRTTAAPPIAAIEWVRRNVAPGSLVYVHYGIGPQATLLLSDYQQSWYEDRSRIEAMTGEAWLIDLEVAPGGHNFVRPRNSLWKVIRPRNFESSVSLAAGLLQFREGWYPAEGEIQAPFRWMARSSTTALPPVKGNGTLMLKIFVPVDTIQPAPTVTISMNGAVVASIPNAPAVIEQSWVLPSRSEGWNELTITTSAAVPPAAGQNAEDTRELGLRLDRIAWTPAQ